MYIGLETKSTVSIATVCNFSCQTFIYFFFTDTSFGSHMDEPRILCKCLLKYGSGNKGDVGLQFQLLRAFSTRCLADFHFLKHWFEEEIAVKYNVNEKRMVGCHVIGVYYYCFFNLSRCLLMCENKYCYANFI